MRARFRRTAQRASDEGAYRAIRNLFHKNRAREWEGYFYALEKRCHRRSLPWRSAWFARSLSALYDWTAVYGQSYERAFLVFVLVQIVFGFGYSIFSGRFGLSTEVDPIIVAFALAQALKPFELLAARRPSSTVYTEVLSGAEESVLWIASTVLHSVLSLALIALFLLAVRWRFRRE